MSTCSQKSCFTNKIKVKLGKSKRKQKAIKKKKKHYLSNELGELRFFTKFLL